MTGKANPLWATPKALPARQPPAPPFPWLSIGLGVLGAAVLAGLVQAARKLRITRR
ncbi:hypothetical protein [Trebonia kvetii]|uniref:hypothetical protein n=1 Tax=Trebonia kvetii TaxID=2480626 RepID=UPI001652B656|nr:hypothetical protein [Trebonia kvetii]